VLHNANSAMSRLCARKNGLCAVMIACARPRVAAWKAPAKIFGPLYFDHLKLPCCDGRAPFVAPAKGCSRLR